MSVEKLLTARLEASLAMEGKMDSKPEQCKALFLHWRCTKLVGHEDGHHGYESVLEWHDPPAPSPAYLAGFAAALTAASAAVLQENADGWGWMWPGREELAARIRGLAPSETEEQT